MFFILIRFVSVYSRKQGVLPACFRAFDYYLAAILAACLENEAILACWAND